jgi:GTP cyclohydrolase II
MIRAKSPSPRSLLSQYGTFLEWPSASTLVGSDFATFNIYALTQPKDEGTLRRTLFEETGGSYPELITRHDIKLFLPPIGGLTVYIFGDPAKMSDPNSKLALRIHDECNGSDVFGSDICTCRPYLTFGIEEAVKEAQRGGSGVVIYFRKEGRALGEVTKYLVYNARKRGEDRASEYFKRTENIAGVKDMRFQALMPDILHWLGITKIDRMLSMSNMKHDAIVEQGIPIHERIPIPDEMIPADSRVEIDAKIQAGYCKWILFFSLVFVRHVGERAHY